MLIALGVEGNATPIPGGIAADIARTRDLDPGRTLRNAGT